jgi:tRNA (guanine37-N1)-methyltransferase
MRFDIISIFPESFESYFDASILKRAREAGHIHISIHDLRAFTHDKHHKVDDTPYGGGVGMVMKAEPFFEAVESISQQLTNNNQQKSLSSTSSFQGEGREGFEKKKRIILFSAKGKLFTQADAKRLAGYDRLILLCGRYEGVDERVAEHLADEEISIGEFVLTGGKLPAMIVVDAVARLLPGVLGNESSALDESHSEPGILEYPQYTKPEVFRDWKVPDILLSGHHAEIEKWRKGQSQKIRNCASRI